METRCKSSFTCDEGAFWPLVATCSAVPFGCLAQELAKPKVAPWKKEDKEDKGYYVGRDTGQAPGNDPVMLVACVGAILALSYAFLG